MRHISLRMLMLVPALVVWSPVLHAQDIPLAKILVDGEGWREVARGWPNVTYLEGYPEGTVRIYQTKLAGQLAVGGKTEVLQSTGQMPERNQQSVPGYRIEKDGKSVVRSAGTALEPLKLKGLVAPTCLTVWPDEGHLVIGEADGAHLWAVRIEKDGSFGPGDRYYSLRTQPGEKTPVSAMTMDAGYLLYACTPSGIQVFDPIGRLSGVIAAPTNAPLTAITIGGEKADTLFAASGEKIYARRIQGKASYTLKKGK